MKNLKKAALKKAVKVINNVGKDANIDDYFTLLTFYKPKKPKRISRGTMA